MKILSKKEVLKAFPRAVAGFMHMRKGNRSGYVISITSPQKDLFEVLTPRLSDTIAEAWDLALKHEKVQKELKTFLFNKHLRAIREKYPKAHLRFLNGKQGMAIYTLENKLIGQGHSRVEAVDDALQRMEHNNKIDSIGWFPDKRTKDILTDYKANFPIPLLVSDGWVNLNIPQPWFLYSLEHMRDKTRRWWLAKLKNKDNIVHAEGWSAQTAINGAIKKAKVTS